MAQKLGDIWQQLRVGLEEANHRLVNEFECSWTDLSALIQSQKPAWETVIFWKEPSERITSLDALFSQAAKELLAAPVAVFKKQRIQERILARVDEYQGRIEELVHQLPSSLSICSRELAETLGRVAGRSLWRPRWGRKAHPLPIRAVVKHHLEDQALRRCYLEGDLILLLAQTVLELRTPWQALRHEALRRLSGLSPDSRPLRRRGTLWVRGLARNTRRWSRLLSRLRTWRDSATGELAAIVLRRGTPSLDRESHESAEQRRERFAYWAKQAQAVNAAIQLELDLVEVGRQLVGETTRLLQSVESDYRSLLQELDTAHEWLERWQPEESGPSFPPPKTLLVTAEERLAAWQRAAFAVARTVLLEAVETARPEKPLPGRHPPWRLLRPQKELIAALDGPVRRAVREGLQEAQSALDAIIWEIEHARQVVAFGRETVEREGPPGLEVARESVANALSLLSYQRKTIANPCPPFERTVVRGLATGLLRAHSTLGQAQLGFWGHLNRQGFVRAILEAWELFLPGWRRFLRRSTKAIHRVRWALLKSLGSRRPPVLVRQPVARRSFAPAGRALHGRLRDLPLVYQRLFRHEPLDDPRLLVGRDAEMTAFADLREMWESHQPASAIVVGDHGSGKTSLLNCAAARIFAGLDLVRAEFRERLLTAADMRRFLQNLLALPAGGDPLAALSGARKVVMIEGLERCFLRQAGGFEALRDLLRLIVPTSRDVFWILSTNEVSFRLLNAALNLSEVLSHRIDAMAVGPEDLQNAIVLRHNLSGLRLQFAFPPPDERNGGPVERLLSLEKNPQERFFEALYAESEGLFRDGFRLWRDHIDRVDDGILYMRHFAPTDTHCLASSLPSEHLLTLHAILQHGGLTCQEHSLLFHLPEEESQMRLEVLHNRNWIQPDPSLGNFRIASQFAPLIRRGLRQRNLL